MRKSVMRRTTDAWEKAGYRPCRMCGVYMHPKRVNPHSFCGVFYLPKNDKRRPAGPARPCQIDSPDPDSLDELDLDLIDDSLA